MDTSDRFTRQGQEGLSLSVASLYPPRSPEALKGLDEIALYGRASGPEQLKRWHRERGFPMFEDGGSWHASRSRVDQWWTEQG